MGDIAFNFKIRLTRETSKTDTAVSKAVGKAIKDRVNALHRWQPSDNAAEDLHAANQIERSCAGEPAAEVEVAVTSSDQRERKRKAPDEGSLTRFLVPKNECSDNYKARSVTIDEIVTFCGCCLLCTRAQGEPTEAATGEGQ